MTLKQSYEMDFQHCYKLWRVLNGWERRYVPKHWVTFLKDDYEDDIRLKVFLA